MADMNQRATSKWWLELELALLVLFVAAAYFTRLETLTIRGEESRRALIAREMLETGDWIVPRTQGVPLYSRPPLQNWMIAVLAAWRGDVDLFAVRVPSVCAILLTVILIYGYGRTFLSPIGALAAGGAFASMGQVLELGRLGETDALFTLFVSGSLLVWQAALTRGASPWITWCIPYALAALGTLTKGPQAPVYFVSVVGASLLWTRNWRFAFGRAHLAGIGLFVLILGTWQVPFVAAAGSDGGARMVITDVGHRFLDANWWSFTEHLVEYPLETFACLLPWSGLLIVWLNRDFRRTLGSARPQAVFLATCLVMTFPSVWFPPGSRPRYFMSLYPCIALLVGLAADRVSAATPLERWRLVWPIFVRCTAVAMLGVGAAILVISLLDFGIWFAQPAAFAWVYFLATVGLAIALVRFLPRRTAAGRRGIVLSVAAFVGLTHAGVMINALGGTTVDAAGDVARIRQMLPANTRLVSFNAAHHLFVYHYHAEIPVVDWPEDATAEESQVPYFCIDARELETKQLPFPWEVVSEVSCDRHREKVPRVKMIVGRRTDLDTIARTPDPALPRRDRIATN